MSLAPGTRLGPDTLTAKIGAGGMGEEYTATDTRLDRTVAIKVLPKHVATDLEARQRFEREAKTLAALSHPNICPIFDVGRHDGIRDPEPETGTRYFREFVRSYAETLLLKRNGTIAMRLAPM